MRTYLLFSTLSPQGLQTLRSTPERLLEVNREVEAMGGRVLRQWALRVEAARSRWCHRAGGSRPQSL